jgi:hypothetical protein
MKAYRDFRPTGFDAKGLGCEEQQDWLVAPCGTNRDADRLTRSNWAVMLEAFEACPVADPDLSDFEVHRFGHWGPGWFELVLVRPGSAVAKLAEEFEGALSDYPVLCDSHFSELETNEAAEQWANMRLRARVEVCQRVGCSVFAARRDEVPEQAWEYLQREC